MKKRMILTCGVTLVVCAGLWVDPVTNRTHRMEVQTFFKESAANLAVTYKTLRGGLTAIAYAQIDIPDKQLSIQVQNLDYVQND